MHEITKLVDEYMGTLGDELDDPVALRSATLTLLQIVAPLSRKDAAFCGLLEMEQD